MAIGRSALGNAFKIRKAVIPAAGLGTRLLPITKMTRKEMLPIAGKPMIQYAVEEAAASGVETVVLVLSPGRSPLADYFKRDHALEGFLTQRGMEEEAEELKKLSQMVDIRLAWQDKPNGLGQAIACVRSEVGDEPFSVILPDALIDSQIPCTRQLIDCYDKYCGCTVATREVDISEIERFGILDVIPSPDADSNGRVLRVLSLTERPTPQQATSRYGIFGRYVLGPEIFQYIDETLPGRGGELQLTDSLTACARHHPVYAFCFEGTHHDAGDKLGLIEATIEYGLKDPRLGYALREYLGKLDAKSAGT